MADKVSTLLQRNLESYDIIFHGARHIKCNRRMLILIPDAEVWCLQLLIRSYRPLLADLIRAGRYARGDPEGVRLGISIPTTKTANRRKCRGSHGNQAKLRIVPGSAATFVRRSKDAVSAVMEEKT